MTRPRVPDYATYDWPSDDSRPHLPDEVDLQASPPDIPVILQRPDDPEGVSGDSALAESIDDFPEPRARGPLRDYKHDPRYASRSDFFDDDAQRTAVGIITLAALTAVGLAIGMSIGEDAPVSSDATESRASIFRRGSVASPDILSSPAEIFRVTPPVSAASLPVDVSRASSPKVSTHFLSSQKPSSRKIFSSKNVKPAAIDLEDRRDLTPVEIEKLNEQRLLSSREIKVLFDAAEQEKKEEERQKAIREGRPTEEDWE